MTERDIDASTLNRQGLYPCEAEIARRLSQSEKHWRRIAPQLERQGLPKIDPVMKGRFWPAVEAFFRNRHGLGNMVASQPDGEERWDVPLARCGTRTRMVKEAQRRRQTSAFAGNKKSSDSCITSIGHSYCNRSQ